MERKLIITEDGSHSIAVPVLDEQYHSTHGAIQESEHVFIESGLRQCTKSEITIFEVGFGTGLNALLTSIFAQEHHLNVKYVTVEKYPLAPQEYELLNYAKRTNPAQADFFLKLHRTNWGANILIDQHFTLQKIEQDLRLLNWDSLPLFDLVYFDAFAPNKQPDLWSEDIYAQIYNHCNPGAIFVTYCAKGVVRRGLQNVGFHVERIEGPPGKKEMLRAIK